jgi:hypothetical protein
LQRLDNSNAVIANSVATPGIDGWLWRSQGASGNDAARYVLSDALGSVRAAADQAKAICAC